MFVGHYFFARDFSLIMPFLFAEDGGCRR